MSRLSDAWAALCERLPAAEYRIVRDGYLGYEVQFRRWWLPVWVQCDDPSKGRSTNTHLYLAGARAFAEAHASGDLRRAGKVVEHMSKRAKGARA